MIGTMPLVAQVGNSRWSGDDIDDGTTLRKDGTAIVRLRDLADASVEVFDPQGVAILRVSPDGEVADAHGDIVRRVEATPAALKIADSVVTGTNDLALAVLVTAPELIPEVRALAACRRLFAREQAARK